MNKELKYLIDTLKEAGLDREAEELNHLLVKSATVVDEEIEAWQGVIEEIEKPPATQIQGRLIKWFVQAATSFREAEELKTLKPEEIKESASTLKKVMSHSNLSPDEFFVKRAGVMGMLGKAAPLFSFIIAAKNMYYGFQEFKKIQSKAGDIGLNWMDTMQPSKMMAKAKELRESPEELTLLVELTKSAMLLWDEGISLVINLIDGFKDLAFLLADILSGGWAAVIDFSISMMLWLLVEAPAEAFMKKQYAPGIDYIKSTAEITIKSLINQKAPPIDDSEELDIGEDEYEEDPDFDAEAWLRTIS